MTSKLREPIESATFFVFCQTFPSRIVSRN
nr:MAG TPA: hypothetical protein [Caudoviricetes sp.]